jgi:hypothetical protein
VIGPWASDGAKHIPTHDPCSQIVHGFSRELIVGVGRSSRLAGHLMKESGFEHPRHQFFAANSQWMVAVLPWPRGETVERYRKPASSHFSHCVPLSLIRRPPPVTSGGRTTKPEADICSKEI